MKKISPTRRAALLLGRSFDKMETDNKELKRKLKALENTMIFVIGSNRVMSPTNSSEDAPICAISMDDVIRKTKISDRVVLSTSGNNDYIQVPRNGHLQTTFKAAK